jgi:hypothetical protein
MGAGRPGSYDTIPPPMRTPPHLRALRIGNSCQVEGRISEIRDDHGFGIDGAVPAGAPVRRRILQDFRSHPPGTPAVFGQIASRAAELPPPVGPESSDFRSGGGRPPRLRECRASSAHRSRQRLPFPGHLPCPTGCAITTALLRDVGRLTAEGVARERPAVGPSATGDLQRRLSGAVDLANDAFV